MFPSGPMLDAMTLPSPPMNANQGRPALSVPAIFAKSSLPPVMRSTSILRSTKSSASVLATSGRAIHASSR